MRILYFAALRERLGMAEETVNPPDTIRTVGDLIDWLRGRDPEHAAALRENSMIRVAVNQDYARPEDPVQATDEIAIFPPVTGG